VSLSYQFDANLRAHNSLAIPATAKVLVKAHSIDDLRAALDYAKASRLRVLVLGEGSNTLFASDFDGMVVLNGLRGIEVVDRDSEYVLLRVAAGENWHELVKYTVDQQWYGLENLALIPGLVGAAPIQNIGAYGAEVKDTIVQVEAIDIKTGRQSVLVNDDCHFRYRDSIFKHTLKDRVIISTVTFRLHRHASCNISYPALSEHFTAPPTLNQVFETVCKVRANKLPLPAEIPNAGSFFKNPVVSQEQHTLLLREYPDLVSFPFEDGYKLAAAWLIENSGWKEKHIDGITVHRDQALVVVNPRYRGGSQVLNFARAILKDIKIVYGVELEIEPRIV